MLKQLSKEIFEAEKIHNRIRMVFYRKQAELLEESKTLGEAKIKSNACDEYEAYLASKRNIDFIKRKLSTEVTLMVSRGET